MLIPVDIQQEPEIEKFYKGRGLLICEAKQGLFALKEYFGSAQKAEFLYWLGICLEQQGILCDSMLKNKDGNLITESGRRRSSRQSNCRNHGTGSS